MLLSTKGYTKGIPGKASKPYAPSVAPLYHDLFLVFFQFATIAMPCEFRRPITPGLLNNDNVLHEFMIHLDGVRCMRFSERPSLSFVH